MSEMSFINIDSFVENATERAATEFAIKITARAKSLCPVDKGPLRNSVMWKSNKQEGGFNDSPGEKANIKIENTPKKFEIFVGSRLPYAIYQELGTRRIAPQPYLRPAIALAKGADKSDIKSKIERETSLGVLHEKREKVVF